MTRLLNSPIAGPSAANVTSSWSDRLAGLSKWYIFSTPLGFCACAGAAAGEASNRPAPIVSATSFRAIRLSLTRGIIAVGPADVGFIKFLVGLVETALADGDSDRIVLARYARVPVGGLDQLEPRVD